MTGRTVHVCAAPEDAAVLRALVKHLAGVRVTHAGLVPSGADVERERRAMLDAARVIVLLVSADFIASGDGEADAKRALERHEAESNGARVVPVICRPCNWESLPYARLRFLPHDERPVFESGSLREEALRDIAREIHEWVIDPAEIDARCPFPGLEFFDEERAADFFGREAEVEEALALLAGSRPPRRWLQIDGPSGAGKSSFARAGIVPAVRAGKLASGPKAWVTAVMRPGYEPIASLAEALVKHARPALAVKGSLDAVTRELASSPTALKSLLRESMPDGHGVLLLVDQLEETFTLAHGDAAAVKQLDALLAAALDDREGRLVLVTTIRSDFVARMGELPSLEAKLPAQAVRYYLRPMTDDGLRAAIERPAERVGLRYDEGLVDRIVADASTSRGALPLVAHVLEALYARRERLALTARAYDAIGGVAGALARSADAIIDSLDDDGRDRARKLLLRLVKIGRGSEDTRQTASREVALNAAGGGSEAERVLARLSGGRAAGLGGTSEASGRLVVVSGQAESERVDLVHEALIQRWTNLRTWIKEAREALELRDDIEEAARIWEAAGSAKDALPAGRLLARFRGVDRASLQEAARTYLQAAEDAEREAEAKRRDREEREQRQETQRALEAQRRSRRIAAAAVAVALLMGGLVVVALVLRSEAVEQRTRARDASVMAGIRELTSRDDWIWARMLPIHVERPAEQREWFELAVELLYKSPAQVTLRGHRDVVYSAVFSADGERVVTASMDGTARVWSLDGSGAFIELRGNDGIVSSAVSSQDGQRTADTSLSPTGRVWELYNSGFYYQVGLAAGGIGVSKLAALSPDRKRAVVAGDRDTARVLELDGSEKHLDLAGHTDRVCAAAFSADGSRIVTGSQDSTARVWALDGSTLFELKGHAGPVCSVAFSPDGQRVVTASADTTARVWGLDGSGRFLELSGHLGAVYSVAFSVDGQRVVTASGDNTARVWALDGSVTFVLRGHTAPVTSAAFSLDGRRVVTASADDTARVWELERRGVLLDLAVPGQWVGAVAFSRDGKRALVSGLRHDARVWELDGSRRFVDLRGNASSIHPAAFSPDGMRVVTASDDGARVWDLDGSGKTLDLRGPAAIRSAAFSPDGKRVVTGSFDGTARVWELDGSGKTLDLGGPGSVYFAAVSPDGNRVVTSSNDDVVRVYEIGGSGKPIELAGHTQQVRSAIFSPDGTRVVTTSDDSTARVWKLDGSGHFVELRGHQGIVHCAAFSPDGTRVVTAGDDRTARLWELDGSGRYVEIKGHSDSIVSVAFSADGSRILTASRDRTLREWPATVQSLQEMLRAAFPDCLSPGMRRAYLAETEIDAQHGHDECQRMRSSGPRAVSP